jgi:uncharacterized Tic20 family protein
MRDRIIECHTAWIVGYVGYLLVLCLLTITGMLNNLPRMFRDGSPRPELVFFVLAPIVGLLSCLYVCLNNKGRYPSIAPHCREAVNFQVSFTAYQLMTILSLLSFLDNSGGNTGNYDGIGRFFAFLMISPVVPIIEFGRFAATANAIKKVSKGEFYKYPCNLQLW